MRAARVAERRASAGACVCEGTHRRSGCGQAAAAAALGGAQGLDAVSGGLGLCATRLGASPHAPALRAWCEGLRAAGAVKVVIGTIKWG